MNTWPAAIAATIAFLTVAVLSRDKDSDETPFQVVTFIFASMIIIGFGSVLQDAVSGLMSPTENQQGMLYQVATSPLKSLLIYISVICLNGPLPGGVLGLLLLRTRAGVSLTAACVTATLVLAASDIFVVVLVLLRNSQLAGLISARSLPFPLICDFCGGFLAGAVIRLSQDLIFRVKALPGGSAGPAAFLAASGSTTIAATILVLVVFYPIPERIDLGIKSYHDLAIRFGANPETALINVPEEMQFVPVDVGIHNVFSVISVELKNAGRKPAELKLVELSACRKPEDAVAVAKITPGVMTPLSPGSAKLSLGGFQPHLWLRSMTNGQGTNFLTYKSVSLVPIYPRSDGEGRTFAFGAGSHLTTPGLGTTALVLATLPLGLANDSNLVLSLAKGAQAPEPSSAAPCPSKNSISRPESDGRRWYVVYSTDPKSPSRIGWSTCQPSQQQDS